ncbi:YoaK family protein [Streptomyces sp. DSM 44915]|uniref:YoaK family protein n=1 Tax=Streptomyces chisholmiae TaxID=3075540 RepID=A0ABU2JP51_9ACTN|nr:YoaK family protein [Streptomyces sp. DSM 44915]MDT0265988.1 YoaK family protein [Streptomyces sp. DSM 44915]
MSHPAADRRVVRLMLVLTFATGIVDAVGFLALAGIFPGNMTGNLVLLGTGALGGHRLALVGFAVALAAFVAGAALAGLVLPRARTGWRRPHTALFGCVGLLLAGAGCWLAAGPHPTGATLTALTGLLCLGMGVQTAAARHLAVPDVTTVVVTAALAAWAAELADRRGRPHAARRAGAVAALTAGAVAGAAAHAAHPAAGVGLAAAVVLGTTAAGGRGAGRRPGR